MYRAVTRKVEVTVTPRFVSERSSPSNGYFFWAYTINITNLGAETVQLKTRHWRITDALGRLQEVKGPGVVGEQPVLKPGESFEYTSGCPLTTPSLGGSGASALTRLPGTAKFRTVDASAAESPCSISGGRPSRRAAVALPRTRSACAV